MISFRHIPLLAVALVIVGCGSAAASKPTAVPATKAPPTLHAVAARFSQAPAMAINAHKHYTAIVHTGKGNFSIELLPKVAPLAVNNFVFLARHKYYNHNQFFRVIAPFMIQTGDPSNTSFGGPGYTFRDEKVTLKYRPGIVAMANHGPNTNGSQFFICTGPQALQLPSSYTIFGKVSAGMRVVHKIANVPVVNNPSGELSQPLTPVWMKSVNIRVS
ncbi:MAG: peptidylprolyl isomerase [Chloroflexota bacterium]